MTLYDDQPMRESSVERGTNGVDIDDIDLTIGRPFVHKPHPQIMQSD